MGKVLAIAPASPTRQSFRFRWSWFLGSLICGHSAIRNPSHFRSTRSTRADGSACAVSSSGVVGKPKIIPVAGDESTYHKQSGWRRPTSHNPFSRQSSQLKAIPAATLLKLCRDTKTSRVPGLNRLVKKSKCRSLHSAAEAAAPVGMTK